MLPHVVRIGVTSSGLSITLYGSPHDAKESKRMDLASDLYHTILLAERLRARIYAVLEGRAHDDAADPYRQAQRTRRLASR